MRMFIVFFCLIIGIATAKPASCSNGSMLIYMPAILAGHGHREPQQPPPSTKPGVYLLDNYSSYTDSINYLHIVGEIWNNTSDVIRFVRISANLFNSSGKLLDNNFTYTYIDDFPPGVKTCFNLFMPAHADMAYYRFQSLTYMNGGTVPPSMTISNTSGSIGPYGDFQLLGMVRNNTSSTIRFVQPVGTLYNSSGKVVDCDFTFVDGTDIDAGQSSSFKMQFFSRGSYSDVATYRVQVDGMR